MPDKNPACPDSYTELKDWHAIHDKMPPEPDTFYVVGTVVVPTEGYTVELKKTVPQGINPKILLLELNVKRPSEPAAEVLTEHAVRYDEKSVGFAFTVVEVFCGDSAPVLKLDVEVVH